MRTAFAIGRQCIRQKPQRFIATLARHERHYTAPSRWRIPFRPPPRPPRGRILIWSLLSPAAFVALSEEDYEDGKTPEMHMLEASRAELSKEVPDDVRGLKRAWKGFYLFVDTIIIEPLATTFRFLHLFIIFVPVILTIPVIWVGPRRKARDSERAGTLWWYSFLVHSMERAGPAFIKVVLVSRQQLPMADSFDSSLANGQLQDQTSSLKRCAIRCPPFIPMHQLTP